MEKSNFEEIITKLNYPKNKWLFFHEIESLFLKSGKGIYPNWKHLKFLVKDDNNILVKHGRVKPYGARLSGLIYVSGDFTSMTFTTTERGIPIENSSFYGEVFRQPKPGDIIRTSEGVTNIIGESHIKAIKPQLNSIIVDLWSPIKINKNSRISFFDPNISAAKSDDCIHGTISEGIFMLFIPNEIKSPNKKYGIFHEEIKWKDIKEINLTVGKEYFDKTYKLE
jgi:hypothetical protein